jgi:hypothetical protein
MAISIREAVTKPAGSGANTSAPLAQTWLYQGQAASQDAVIEMGEALAEHFPTLRVHEAAMKGGGVKPDSGERNVPLALAGRIEKVNAVFTFYNTKRSEVKLVCTNVALPEDLAGNAWVQL